jgi:hypothetical protein
MQPIDKLNIYTYIHIPSEWLGNLKGMIVCVCVCITRQIFPFYAYLCLHRDCNQI